MSMDLTGALTNKIGPLPGYAYVGLGVGGIFLYKKFRPTKTATVSPSTDAPTTLGISPTASVASTTPSTLPDNSAWALAAAQHLATTTPLNGGEISTALANYLAGGGLSGAQQNIVNQAIAAQGFPSQGLIPVVAQDVPAPLINSYQPTPVNMPYDPTPNVTNNYYSAAVVPSVPRDIAPTNWTLDPAFHVPTKQVIAPIDTGLHPPVTPAPAPTPAVRSGNARNADSWS